MYVNVQKHIPMEAAAQQTIILCTLIRIPEAGLKDVAMRIQNQAAI
jgi:hypothetical protein